MVWSALNGSFSILEEVFQTTCQVDGIMEGDYPKVPIVVPHTRSRLIDYPAASHGYSLNNLVEQIVKLSENRVWSG